MCNDDEWDDYPDEPSWDLARSAIAFDSDAGFCKQLDILVIALANAGTFESLSVDGDHEYAIAQVEWRTAPWLAVRRWRGTGREKFLFDTWDEAVEWVQLRVEQDAAEAANE